MISMEEMREMLKKIFNLNLKATVSHHLMEERIRRSQSERKYYFLPYVDGISHILSFSNVFELLC